MAEQEDVHFGPFELSDGTTRRRVHYSWYERRSTWITLLCMAIFTFTLLLAQSSLLSSTNHGIHGLLGVYQRAEGRAIDGEKLIPVYKIVSWCDCGLTLKAGGYSSGLPLEAKTCDGCFSPYDALTAQFPKSDYDSTENVPSINSFIFQMHKEGVTDEVIVSKCGWTKMGTKYYAYQLEEVNIRMCVIEAFINHMGRHDWVINLENWAVDGSANQLTFISAGTNTTTNK